MTHRNTELESNKVQQFSLLTVFQWLILRASIGIIAGPIVLITGAVHASEADDRRNLIALDTTYQRAVKDNDARTMAAILADNFVLVEGDGKRSTKADLIKSATDGRTHYEHQEDSDQVALVYGDTAIVTAKLWAKGLEDGVKVNYTQRRLRAHHDRLALRLWAGFPPAAQQPTLSARN